MIYVYICLLIAFGFWDLRPFDSIQSNCRHFQVPRSSQCQFHLHSTEAASSHQTQQLRFSGSGCAFFTTEEWPWCKAIGASRLHDMSVLLIWKIKWPVFKNMKIIYIMEYERISSFMHIVGLCQCCCGLPLLSMSECSNSLQDLPLLGVLVAHYVCYTQPTIRLLAQRHDVLLHSNASRIVQPLGIPCVYYMTDLSWIFACMYN